MSSGDPTDGTRRIRALRLRNQGLVAGRQAWESPAEVAKGMLAMQGQAFAGVKHALSLRCGPPDQQPDEDAVEQCFVDGRVVRNRPSRGTLQVTAPEDLGWMTRLMSPRSNAAAAKRREDLGVTQEMLDGVETVLRTELADGSVLTRKELQECFAEAGLPGAGPQASHMLGHHTTVMTIVYAAPEGKAETYALADHWISDSREPDDDEAAGAELATRFFAARGPATVKDLAWWSNLTMGGTRSAIEAAGAAIEAVEIDETEYLVTAGSADLAIKEIDAALAEPLLLPSFDEYLLGYTDRAAVLLPELATRVQPGANGMFKAIVVVDGEVVGTWQRSVKAKTVAVEVTPFAKLSAAAEKGVRVRAEGFGAYLGRISAVTFA